MRLGPSRSIIPDLPARRGESAQTAGFERKRQLRGGQVGYLFLHAILEVDSQAAPFGLGRLKNINTLTRHYRGAVC
jgi:hypothetical protein